MVVFPNAKINIGLQVLNRRSDGYHNLSSIFYPVKELCDVLEVVENKEMESDEIHYSGLNIPGNADGNLIFKAIQGLRESYDFPFLKVYLHKAIPMGAGLGGGSSDGTFTLKLINELFRLGINHDEMNHRALQLGSDCPFFIANETVLASGRGEIMSPLSLNLERYYIAIAFSPFHISTADAYANVEFEENPSCELEKLNASNILGWKQSVFNGFEPFALLKYPALKQVKDYLYDKKALFASMTGSGSAVYGIFEELPEKLNFDGFEFWRGALK